MATSPEHRRLPTVAAVLYGGAGHEHLGIDFSPLAAPRAREKARWWHSTAQFASTPRSRLATGTPPRISWG